MNITPNSFSDGGSLQSYEETREKLHYFVKLGTDVFDIGAESTAPMNEKISGTQERERLGNFFSLLERIKEVEGDLFFKLSDKCWSIDSYRYETAEFFAKEIDRLFSPKKTTIIWNDVSGILNDETASFLNDNPHSLYILCHNEANDRELSGKHMDYCLSSEVDIVEHVHNFFKERLSPFPEELLNRIILDPCFGFSKTYEQNWTLIHNWEQLIAKHLHHSWVFGVSKKSFLREKLRLEGKDNGLDTSNLSKEKLLALSEFTHRDLIKSKKESWPIKKGKDLYFRVHDPCVILF